MGMLREKSHTEISTPSENDQPTWGNKRSPQIAMDKTGTRLCYLADNAEIKQQLRILLSPA
jgi:hypothetical protein